MFKLFQFHSIAMMYFNLMKKKRESFNGLRCMVKLKQTHLEF